MSQMTVIYLLFVMTIVSSLVIDSRNLQSDNESTLIGVDRSKRESKNPQQFAKLNIGTVDLSQYPLCKSLMDHFTVECTIPYDEQLKYVYRQLCKDGRCPFEYRPSQLVKTKCCCLWDAQNCMIRKIESSSQIPYDCPENLITRYKELPTDREIKEYLDDYCTEYQYGSAICSSSTVTVALPSMVFLLTLMALIFNN